MTAFPLFKQYNWNLQSVASMNGSAFQNVDGDTAPPTLVPLTAGGFGGAGLLAATASLTSSTSTPPSPTNSSEAGRASASPASGAKKNGAASGLRSSSLAGVLSVALALSVCLI
jgi:hypothetical protein